MSTEDNSSNIEQTIPSTTEIIQKAQEVQQNQQQVNPNEIEKSTIEWVSMDSCGGCKQQDDFFNNTLKPQRDVPTEITKVDINSERGQQIADENNLKYVPFAKECLIFKDKNKQPECKTYNRYDPKDWKLKVNETSSSTTQ